MLQGWIVIAVALGYICLLFVIASYGDRTRALGREGGWRNLIYRSRSRSTATSWTSSARWGSPRAPASTTS